MIKKTERNLMLLSIVFIVSLIIANVTAPKLMDLPFRIFTEYRATVSVAIFMYAMTFLVADIVGEIWDKKTAQRLILYGFFAQVFASILILIGFVIPASEAFAHRQDAYRELLGMNWLIVTGSLTAYLVSKWTDVHIFFYIRAKTNTKHKWLRNNVSTILSQFIDTVIFSVIGFGLSNIVGFNIVLLDIIVASFLVKVIVTITETPFFYLFTGKEFGKKEIVEGE
ncbi:MAG: queuosine precursor transporter [Erysipelotrichales bacterium]|nr:queuosine precursor transporter [Erysipelotrichales bacterium]